MSWPVESPNFDPWAFAGQTNARFLNLRRKSMMVCPNNKKYYNIPSGKLT
jgi:hypothetical protein